ncbi:MAG: lateral flagellar hook-associated protein 2 [Roseateles sp.]|nr:MAG: lateral flagellar hook-associated protein 2 [Roseateles sp.]
MATTSFDPTTMAQQLATAYTQPTQTLLDAQTKAAQAQSTGLSSLQSVLSTFKTALSSLSSIAGQGVTQYSATASDSSYFTATASSKAQPVSMQLFVEQVATTHQIAFKDLPAVPKGSGSPMTVNLGDGSSFTVDLSAADTDGDGTLSQAEIARAINSAASGKVTAMVVTANGQTQMMITSGASGAAGKITLDTSAMTASPLKTALEAPTELTAAQDAVVWLGGTSGTRLQQSSNTVTAIAGVTVTLTKAQAAGANPLTLSVARDDSATSAKLQSFVDAYNKLETALDGLTAAGANGATPGAFASDSGVRALKDGLANLLRKDFGSSNLRTLGVSVDRNGQLTLDKTKLSKALATNPLALDDVLGNTSLSAPSGLLGAASQLMDRWTNTASGQIKQRQDSVQAQQKSIAARQTKLQDQYTSAYNRYLLQFTQLQQLQSQMSDTSGLFT